MCLSVYIYLQTNLLVYFYCVYVHINCRDRKYQTNQSARYENYIGAIEFSFEVCTETDERRILWNQVAKSNIQSYWIEFHYNMLQCKHTCIRDLLCDYWLLTWLEYFYKFRFVLECFECRLILDAANSIRYHQPSPTIIINNITAPYILQAISNKPGTKTSL